MNENPSHRLSQVAIESSYAQAKARFADYMNKHVLPL